MAREWIQVSGILRKGYGVASGHSQEYPYGSLERQFPIFKARGLDLGGCFLGTLNIDIRPLVFQLVKPEFTFRDVSWTELHPPEHFSFSRFQVAPPGRDMGWIYIARRPSDALQIVLLISQRIPDLSAGRTRRIHQPERTVLKQTESIGASPREAEGPSQALTHQS
jgi:hypothetical protein